MEDNIITREKAEEFRKIINNRPIINGSKDWELETIIVLYAEIDRLKTMLLDLDINPEPPEE